MRDYYCTSVAKAGYAWHPAEFLFQSGVLAERFDVTIVDAIASNLTAEQTRARVGDRPIDLALGLVGATDPEADLAFLRSLGAKTLAVSGEVVRPDGVELLRRYEFVDGAMVDFSTGGLLDLIDGAEDAPGVAIRRGGEIVAPRPETSREFRVPTPRHDLFAMADYRMPLQKHRPFASLLTDYGCPYDCSFCNTGTLRYRRRPMEDVEAELAAIRRLGVRELFLKNMSFGAHKAHSADVLDLLARHDFTWHTYARIEDLSAEMLAGMAAAGCHLVQIGIEHVAPEILSAAGKRYGEDDIRRVLADAKRVGVDVGFHLVLGLPGETRETLARLRRFLTGADGAVYISVNLYAPRIGSRLEQAQGGGETPHDSTSGSEHGALPRTQLEQARASMYRAFYTRPTRVARLVSRMRPADMWGGVRGIFFGAAQTSPST